jgi:hypothetical protein
MATKKTAKKKASKKTVKKTPSKKGKKTVRKKGPLKKAGRKKLVRKKRQTRKRRKPGRPRIEVTAGLVRTIEGLAANGLTKEQIARSCGFSYETLNEKSKQYSEISEAIKNGRAKGIATVTNSLFTQAVGGNLGATCFYLTNRDPKQWRNKQEHEVSGKDGTPLLAPTLIVQTGKVIKPE